MAKQPAKKKPQSSNQTFAFDIPAEEPRVCFTIKDDSGKVVGKIEDDLIKLHHLVMSAQYESFEGKEEGEVEELAYIPIFTQTLGNTYGVKVTEAMAYRMAGHIFDLFAQIKKN